MKVAAYSSNLLLYLLNAHFFIVNAQQQNGVGEEEKKIQPLANLEVFVQPEDIGLMFGLFVDRMQVVSEVENTISFDGIEIVSQS